MSSNPFERIEYDYGAENKQHESRAIYAETELNCYTDEKFGVIEVDGAQRYFASYEQAKKIYKQMVAISHKMVAQKEKQDQQDKKDAANRLKAKSS